MSILYNCKPMHTSGMYNITKFDDDMNVVSSYVTTITGDCDCPRGPHPTCRHRQMLPQFIARQHIGDEWFLDFDRGGWVQMGDEWKQQEGWGEIKPEDIGKPVRLILPKDVSPSHIKRRF